MRWAILSDVHGNLEAFRAVLEDLRREGADRVIFLGDVLGYGADPEACLALLRSLTDWVVAGNHDYGAVGLADMEDFNAPARSALAWTRARLSEDSRAYLRGLPLLRQEKETTFVHSSPNRPADWNYLFTYPEAEDAFRSLAGNLAFAGHTHRPLVLGKGREGEVQILNPEAALLKEGVSYIINVGSVGQPRDGHPEAAYGLFEEPARRYRLKRVAYDVRAAQKKILSAGLPSSLAKRLSRGM